MKIVRREFLKRSALGVGGMLLGSRMASADTPAAPTAQSGAIPTYFDPFEKVALGKSGLKPSRVCMGTGTHGVAQQSNQTRLGSDNFDQLLRDAYERGVRTFDSADQYGTHPYIARAFKDVPRDSYQIFSKIRWHGDVTPDANVFVDRFLKELNTDHIDLLLMHCMTSGNWPQTMRKQMDILSGYKEKGVIRALGVSCHSIPALEAAAAEPWVDSVHTRINPFGMSMDGAPDDVVPVIRKIHAAGKGVVGMKIIGAGKLKADSDRRLQSVQYALGLGCVNILNVGFESIAQIDNLADHVHKTQVAKAA
jgi:aryl-alcohol dehydrogenase-like predicted oxidoreductase